MNIKKIITSLLLFLFIASAFLTLKAVFEFEQEAYAQDVTSPLEQIEQTTKLPTFEQRPHEKASIEAGASSITSAIYFVLDFMKFLIGGIAVVMIIVTGIRLVMARKKIDDVWSKQKEHLIFIVVGFVIIMVADFFVKNVFFGIEGEVYESQAQAEMAAEEGVKQLKGMYNAAFIIVGALAVFMLVIAGIRLLVSGGNEEVQTKVKKQVTWLVIGLFILGIAEFVVQDFIFPKEGTEIPAAVKGQQLIVSFTNFAAAFVSIAAVIACIYGGYLYVSAVGNEEKTGKAKKVFIGAIIALVLAAGAFALVNTVIPLEPGT